MKQSGKTLFEILIVMVVIALLLSLVVGGIHQVRSYAKRTSCASNLRQIYIVIKSYVEDYDAPPPRFVSDGDSQKTKWHWDILVSYQPHIKSLLVCPADSTRGTRTRLDNQPHPYSTAVSYLNLYIGYVPLAHPDPAVVEFDKWFKTIDLQNSDEVLVLCEWHNDFFGRVWALFADGRVAWARYRSCTVDGRTVYYLRPVELTEEQCRMLVAR